MRQSASTSSTNRPKLQPKSQARPSRPNNQQKEAVLPQQQQQQQNKAPPPPQAKPTPDPNDPANSYAAQQVQDRAITILTNDQLLMRYAIANDISIPQTRSYFIKVAAGYNPEPVIKNWYPFTSGN